jgi:hypothetical protein
MRPVAFSLVVLSALAGLGLSMPETAAAAPAASSYPPVVMIAPFGSAAPSGGSPAPVFTPAPVPNIDAAPPRTAYGDPNAPTVSPSLIWGGGGRASLGDGFTPGSIYTGEQEKRFKPGPGVNVSVPIQ